MMNINLRIIGDLSTFLMNFRTIITTLLRDIYENFIFHSINGGFANSRS